MFALVGVLLFIGAPVIAIAQLLFSAGLGLVYFFAIDSVEDPEASETESTEASSWGWLATLLGVAGACLMASLLIGIAPTGAGSDAAISIPRDTNPFAGVGLEVIVGDGLALLGVGLVLVASAVAAGYLSSKDPAE